MFKQDYIMRMIKELVRTILKLLFNISTESPTVELLENKEEKALLEELLDMVDGGCINEAENQLYGILDNCESSGLMMALLFYSYLNDKTDEFLETNDFSREEIRQGMEMIADRFGLNDIVRMFWLI